MIQQIRAYSKQFINFFSKKYTVLFLVICVISLSIYSSLLPCIPTSRIDIQGKKLWICVMDTPELHQKGLSGSHILPRSMGMLFVFEKYGIHTFWMEDMNYNIDIIWLNDDFTPSEIARNASPDSYPGTYSPRYVHKLVLETRPGVIEGQYTDVPLVNK